MAGNMSAQASELKDVFEATYATLRTEAIPTRLSSAPHWVAFKALVLEECSPEKLAEREQHHINKA